MCCTENKIWWEQKEEAEENLEVPFFLILLKIYLHHHNRDNHSKCNSNLISPNPLKVNWRLKQLGFLLLCSQQNTMIRKLRYISEDFNKSFSLCKGPPEDNDFKVGLITLLNFLPPFSPYPVCLIWSFQSCSNLTWWMKVNREKLFQHDVL